jgi:hypothetical protein
MDDASVYRKEGCKSASLFKRCSQSGLRNQHPIPTSLEINTGIQHASNIFHTAKQEMVRF